MATRNDVVNLQSLLISWNAALTLVKSKPSVLAWKQESGILKVVFSLNYTQVMLIQFTFFAAYFIVSLPSGSIVEKVGYQRGIVIGLVAAAVGCLMFYPAAGSRSYPIFLAALFVLAGFATGGVVSASNDAPSWVLAVHRIVPWPIVALIGLTLYRLAGKA